VDQISNDDTSSALQQAAVLVPVFRRDDGDMRVVVVRRGSRGMHGGQLGFPGGKAERGDASLLATALRETREEIGLAPENIGILERLPVVDIVRTGFRIQPFLGCVVAPPVWRYRQGEIAGVLELKVADLSAARGHDWVKFPGEAARRRIEFFRIGDERLWGASYRMLSPLLERLLAGAWPI
jgi:8-oxo-dGTP pyrophosphatase MutT (NUDIX family)